MDKKAYDAGFEAGMLHAKDIAWHFLAGQAMAEQAQGKTLSKQAYKHTIYLRNSLERFLKGTIK